MGHRHQMPRDLQARKDEQILKDHESKVLRISDLVPLARKGQISHAKFLTITREILDGDADRVVRIGDDYRPDITTEERR